MKSPLISIITPTYNAESTVEKTLTSVANQQYKSIEHIFIDGHSVDSTTAIIRTYQQKNSHIRLISEKDRGLYDAINKGMTLCTGDWIFIMGADDEFYNDHVLADLVDQGWFLEEQIVYGNVLIRGDVPWAESNSVYDGPFDLQKLCMRNLCHQSIFYPRSVINRIGYYSNKYPVTADWDYNIHCFAHYTFAYTGMTIAIFNGGGKSSKADDNSFFKDLPEKVIQYFRLNPKDRTLHTPDSPYYYPVALYRENQYITNLRKAEDEIVRLKAQVTAQQEEFEGKLAKIIRDHEGNLEALKSDQEQFKQKEAEADTAKENDQKRTDHLVRTLAEKESQYAQRVAIAKRDTENLRAELAAHKQAIESLVNSYTWKTGRLVLAPFRFFRKKREE